MAADLHGHTLSPRARHARSRARRSVVPRAAESSEIDGRAIDRAGDGPAPTFVPGTVHGEREQLALFGRDALALEVGRFASAGASEMFAEARLEKASPALRAEPLARAPSAAHARR